MPIIEAQWLLNVFAPGWHAVRMIDDTNPLNVNFERYLEASDGLFVEVSSGFYSDRYVTFCEFKQVNMEEIMK